MERKSITVWEDEYDTLITLCEDQKQDLEVLRGAVMSVMKLFGLTKANGQVDEDYLNGTKNVFKPIAKEITSTAADLTVIMMKMPGSKRKEDEMGHKFKFMKDVLPLLKKYYKPDPKQLADGTVKLLK